MTGYGYQLPDSTNNKSMNSKMFPVTNRQIGHPLLNSTGIQVDSTRNTFPIYSVPRQQRDTYNKQYLSKELITAPRGIPGAIYDTEHCYPKDKCKFVNFGLCKPRDPLDESKVTYLPVGTHYGGGSSFGKQPTTEHQSRPQYRFGKTTRDKQSKLYISKEFSSIGEDSPGPNTRGPYSSIGTQASSVKTHEPRATFGNEKRFFTIKSTMGDNPPDPGTYF
mmetsp:Transcript_8943/g.15322  ORF Transcript_8943/g.15322 Transcript_8943/m.15322 type:complete len:220 (-) Transcript_8943:496-1155(-)|eukprot:CAMPEP_0198217670 /NCGR_PEP_ID=MMETSP1445-20131203/65152_1 /TAXON_ID=36898 /ORGANISM="Pyramimonas sp., Strain CCMP2087" /LENGTH=219 /DNA_ID=CAMNT_0043894437 /DNA_START=188 /DNA_END=847 /DNA_ORIENTATION=+